MFQSSIFFKYTSVQTVDCALANGIMFSK